MKVIFEREIFTYLMIGMITAGVVSKLLIGIVYDVLIHETENMAASKNRLLKQMKLKFENCYKLNLGVNNISIFVDRYMYKYRICGVSLSQIRGFSSLVLILIVIMNLIAFVYALSGDYAVREYLWYGIVAAVSGLLFLFIEKAVDTREKEKIVIVNIRDYLENSLVNRLAHEYADNIVPLQMGDRLKLNPEQGEDMEKMKVQLDKIETQTKKTSENLSDLSEEEVIHEILKEFLT